MKPRIYIDMDDTLCDFMGAQRKARINCPVQKYPQAQMDFFRKLKPISGAIEAVRFLRIHFDVWILTRPSIYNPLCYTEKRLWIEDHLGIEMCHKLILCPDKSLLKGDILIDDQPWDGFEGYQILFGDTSFPDWSAVLTHLRK